MSMQAFDALNRETITARADVKDAFGEAVREGLSRAPRELPSRYLYDEIGSLLYDVITRLPEYGLSRADERILSTHAASIVRHLPDKVIVAELGSGSGRKSRPLLEVLAGRTTPLIYVPIDISPTALNNCRKELTGVGGLSLVGLERSYLEGLEEVSRRRPPDHALLVLFIGSTLGNFERDAAEVFLTQIRQALQPGDALLLGTDLEKPAADLLPAYDDPLGVTAAFNRNILARINRELQGTFVLDRFQHCVRYDDLHRRIEMHLRADRPHTVHIRGAGLSCRFEAGETICTEACHKFDVDELRVMAHRNGFRCEAQWMDREWPFAESLWLAG
ncbi:MAG TPA: L-histidine N(alpha)-methyltransferase [Nitrospira sp.]|nr:L-histidine N(alpha)-methyltransferase [Nitrospira sp.]